MFRVNTPIAENHSGIVSRKCQMKRAAYATWFDEFYSGKRSSIWIDDQGVCHDPHCMVRGRCKNNCSSVDEIPPIKFYSRFLVPILLPLVAAALKSAVEDWATMVLDTEFRTFHFFILLFCYRKLLGKINNSLILRQRWSFWHPIPTLSTIRQDIVWISLIGSWNFLNYYSKRSRSEWRFPSRLTWRSKNQRRSALGEKYLV